MFIINGTPLSRKDHPQEIEWMEKKFNEIRSRGKKVFTFSAFNKKNMIKLENGRIVPQKDRKRLVSMIGTTSEATGQYQTWAYATGMPALKSDDAGGYALRRSTRAMDYDTIFDVDRDIELIFFFEFLSNNKNIRRIDYEKIAETNAKKIALESTAQSLIYSTDSKIHPETAGSQQPIRNIALSWGIMNANELNLYSLMNTLWQTIKSSHENINKTHRGYEEFIKQVKEFNNNEKRAEIVHAISRGLLVFDTNIWKLISEGGSEQFLCGVPINDSERRDEYLVNYLILNEMIYDTVSSMLKSSIEKEKKAKKEEIENVAETMDRGILLKKAQEELGWKGPNYKKIVKMNNSELAELVATKRTPQNIEVEN